MLRLQRMVRVKDLRGQILRADKLGEGSPELRAAYGEVLARAWASWEDTLTEATRAMGNLHEFSISLDGFAEYVTAIIVENLGTERGLSMAMMVTSLLLSPAVTKEYRVKYVELISRLESLQHGPSSKTPPKMNGDMEVDSDIDVAPPPYYANDMDVDEGAYDNRAEAEIRRRAAGPNSVTAYDGWRVRASKVAKGRKDRRAERREYRRFDDGGSVFDSGGARGPPPIPPPKPRRRPVPPPKPRRRPVPPPKPRRRPVPPPKPVRRPLRPARPPPNAPMVKKERRDIVYGARGRIKGQRATPNPTRPYPLARFTKEERKAMHVRGLETKVARTAGRRAYAQGLMDEQWELGGPDVSRWNNRYYKNTYTRQDVKNAMKDAASYAMEGQLSAEEIQVSSDTVTMIQEVGMEHMNNAMDLIAQTFAALNAKKHNPANWKIRVTPAVAARALVQFSPALGRTPDNGTIWGNRIIY